MSHASELTDAAKRVADTYALHKIAGGDMAYGKWFAVTLADGRSDDVLYDNRKAAVKFQKNDENYYAFVQVGPWTMTPGDASNFLALHRRMYDAGLRMADPDEVNGGKDVIKRVSADDQRNQIAAMFGHGKPTNISYRK